MLERINSWVCQSRDKRYEHKVEQLNQRAEHHREILQSMVDQLNQWDYRHTDPYTTVQFLKPILKGGCIEQENIHDFGFFPRNDAPKELDPFLTDMNTNVPLLILFSVGSEYNIVLFTSDMSLNYKLAYNHRSAPVHVSPFVDYRIPELKGAQYCLSFNQLDSHEKLEFVGKIIAAAASHELSQH